MTVLTKAAQSGGADVVAGKGNLISSDVTRCQCLQSNQSAHEAHVKRMSHTVNSRAHIHIHTIIDVISALADHQQAVCVLHSFLINLYHAEGNISHQN